MKLRIDTIEIDIGRASEMSGTGGKTTQGTDYTGSGEEYTVTWSYYTGRKFRFTFQWMTAQQFEDLISFHRFEAKSKMNLFEVDLDNGESYNNCKFVTDEIEYDSYEIWSIDGTSEQPVYTGVNFEIKAL